MRVTGVAHILDVLDTHQTRETTGAFYNKTVIEFFDADTIPLQGIGAGYGFLGVDANSFCALRLHR
jgi:hypothetical protein